MYKIVFLYFTVTMCVSVCVCLCVSHVPPSSRRLILTDTVLWFQTSLRCLVSCHVMAAYTVASWRLM